jgi:hypothetical protein
MQSVVTASVKCQHALLSSLHPHETQPRCSSSVSPHVSNVRTYRTSFTHILSRMAPTGFWHVSVINRRDSAVRSDYPEGAGPTATIFWSSKCSEWLWDRPYTAQGSRHYSTWRWQAGSERCTTEWAERCTANKATTSAPQPSALITDTKWMQLT